MNPSGPLQRQDLLDLVLLGAIWGGSFLLMRVAAPQFGPLALIAVRVAVGALAMLLWLRSFALFRGHWTELTVMGAINTAIPFSLFSFAILHISAGMGALINATAPIFGALLSGLFLGERLGFSRWSGIGLAFGGIALIVAPQIGAGQGKVLLGVAAGLTAAVLYACAVIYAKRKLYDVDSRAVAAGSLVTSTLLMLIPGTLAWPEVMPSPIAWLCAITLGLVCSALAYVMYFRLLARIGASRSVAVGFLIPVFGIAWGALVLGEAVNLRLLLGGGITLLGTALAIGILRIPFAQAR